MNSQFNNKNRKEIDTRIE